ncbi:MAG: hypothetical protein HZB51_08460 [Chloroflexi bacterium]|nr:hypothetical protein [Chloroflexota bacterium]
MPDVLDLLGVWIGVLLTLLVFSYLLHDSPLFRIAQAIFVGVTVGYAATVALRAILVTRLFVPLLNEIEFYWPLIIPFILGLLLFTKWRAAWASVGNIPIAFLFGVGSALAIGGALTGTLWPQMQATMVSLSPSLGLETIINNLLLVIGTIGAFLSFRFILPTSNRAPLRALDVAARGWSFIGRWFIFFAFGAIFADTAVSRVSILVSRFYYVLQAFGVR